MLESAEVVVLLALSEPMMGSTFSHSATRLTAYALISALEGDLRSMAREFLKDSGTPSALMGEELYSVCRRRCVADVGSMLTYSLGDLLEYADFGQLVSLLTRHRQLLPATVAVSLKNVASELQRLAPIRNRVMHGRPLEFDDLAVTLGIVAKLLSEDAQLFDTLSSESKKIGKDPAVVLGIQIPPSYAESRGRAHNLPIPDFDETGFIGRKETVKQLKTLCAGPYPVITIVGEGGLGKTSLALKLAYDLLDDEQSGFDAIVWTTCKTTTLTAQEIVRIDEAIRDSLGMFTSIAAHLAGDKVQVAEPMEEILNYLQTFKILLVLDNLETVLDARVIEFIRSIPPGSKILATSRIGMGAYEYPVKLERMNEGESVQLLRALARIRGTDRLLKMPNVKVAQFCARMQHNPGWIKWFVAATQAGKRPEDVLSNPRMFLEFCMSNVYEFLTQDSKALLEVMVAIPTRHGQADLSFLANMEPAKLQRALQQLIATNMVTMVSTPSGATFYTTYEISELARVFLRMRYPVEAKKLQAFNRRMQHLRRAEQEIAGGQRHNPYYPLNISMRGKGDIVPAKYLKDALDMLAQGQMADAERLVRSAQELSPDYYEGHRVEAYIHEHQGEQSLAEAAYERAVDLEPQSAPLRAFYAKCLVKSGAIEAAFAQIQRAEALAPNEPFLQLEKARAFLYMHQFDDGRGILESLSKRDDLSTRMRIAVTDTYLQYFQRKAEAMVDQTEFDESLELLDELRSVYLKAPPSIRDDKMRTRLRLAIDTAMQCVKKIRTPHKRRNAIDLYLWFQAQSGARASVVTEIDKHNGAVTFAPYAGKEIRVTKDDFLNAGDWDRVKVGSYVYYCVTSVEGGAGSTAGVVVV